MSESALIVGASGIVGSAAARRMADEGWPVFGLARTSVPRPGVTPVSADLRDPDSLRRSLRNVAPSVVVLATWLRQPTEAENITVNAGMVRNLLDAVRPAGSVRHVALVTGMKHYLGPFETFATGALPDTPFREDDGRLDTPNFYYAQEDELFDAAERDGFTWSVHRAHTMVGFAVGNAMNMGQTLAAYAAICRETGEPFVFPGSRTQWDGLTDVTDARVLASQLHWASTTPAAADTAFNCANGDVFRWRWLWPRLAERLGVRPEGFADEPRPLEGRMDGAAEVWRGLAEQHGLVEADVDRVASWWHTDGDLGRDVECLTDQTRSRRAGWTGFADVQSSFLDLFDRLERERVVPAPG